MRWLFNTRLVDFFECRLRLFTILPVLSALEYLESRRADLPERLARKGSHGRDCRDSDRRVCRTENMRSKDRLSKSKDVES
jgi:hypothetical protein